MIAKEKFLTFANHFYTVIMDELIILATKAAIRAGQKIMEIYDSDDFGVEIKDDNSPLTQADKQANTEIVKLLEETKIPIISEENKEIAYKQRKDWSSCWIVDPLDGTKEFIKRNGEFTVNIALCESNQPKLGIIYVPVTKEIYIGDVKNRKAIKAEVTSLEHHIPDLIENAKDLKPMGANGSLLKVVGSRSHMNDATLAYVDEQKSNFEEVEIVSKGSSLKFCLVAEGKAHVYPRFAPTMEWDTAAGHAICNAVGLKVTSKATNQELQYNKEDLLNSHFLVH